ncbi:type II toxin-antitoxin system VapC family toxin [Ramlibacter sp. H39-3-26]|uniref:type II toxin-antitoxin system VapC family toxin n=1 Tax=Curvibacter soli TaxID=3031331 RepID=UPI0023DB2CB5|nr:type II toxin-antitoxin system VapC family toxin [Ramlibacter sp. H39-3-26]MDF1485701.1 type II toxin-antitoxin system VapC family toxin [Ramlibacter sp. H39-3-26]
MTRYLLDTNTVSLLIRQHPAVLRRVVATPMANLAISAVTEAELLFGLAKRPQAQHLHAAVHEFLRRVDAIPWDSATAARYGALRASLERQGRMLAALDLLIAAHALALGAVLVSNDQAFAQVPGLALEDWKTGLSES